MIREIQIKNFKSIRELTLELGRVNVLIGENGGGKSNILEAIALASAASQDKLGNEFLAARGIRATEPRFMRAAFEGESGGSIDISVTGEGGAWFDCDLQEDSESSATHPRWLNRKVPELSEMQAFISKLLQFSQAVAATKPGTKEAIDAEKAAEAIRIVNEKPDILPQILGSMSVRLVNRSTLSRLPPGLSEFLIYSPENSALRIFQTEGQILPLSIRGEGLFAHLKGLSTRKERACLDAIIEKLSLIDWFERFEVPEDLAPGERSIRIRDRYLVEGALFDQRSANEGFLLLLFYFTLFISPDTPRFFAVDNIDASLNPKLCRTLVQVLVALAREHDRQIILTTHNPAILDGINLNDDEQRLFVVYRDTWGETKLHRVPAPKPLGDEPPVPLSEAFMRGYIGGLPKNF